MNAAMQPTTAIQPIEFLLMRFLLSRFRDDPRTRKP